MILHFGMHPLFTFSLLFFPLTLFSTREDSTTSINVNLTVDLLTT